MPKWLSSFLIIAGFLALVGLAFMPRNVEVAVTITDNSERTGAAPADHGAPAPIAGPED